MPVEQAPLNTREALVTRRTMWLRRSFVKPTPRVSIKFHERVLAWVGARGKETRGGWARSSGIVNGSSKSKSKSDNRKEGTLKPVIYWYPVEAGRMRAESTRLAGRRFAGSCLLAGDVYALGL